MTVLIAKLLLIPALIAAVTAAGRRWGGAASGFLIGMPIVSAPISFILACEYGLAFAGQAAIGSLAGQISNCVFGLTYCHIARRAPWPVSALAASAAFVLMTALLDRFDWQLLPALLVLLCVVAAAARLMPNDAAPDKSMHAPRWDLPARITAATGFMVVLTVLADRLGPQLSGLISPFPVFSLIFATFAHHQSGAALAIRLLRGVVLGSSGFAAFFYVVASQLESWGIALTYCAASLAAISVGAMIYHLERPNPTGR